MMLPMLILTLCSIFIGYLTCDLYLGVGTLSSSTSLLALNFSHLDAEHLSLCIRLIPLVFSILGVLLSLVFYIWFPHILINLNFIPLVASLRFGFNKAWYIDYLLNSCFYSF